MLKANLRGTGAQTAEAIIAAPSGQAIAIYKLVVTTDAATAIVVTEGTDSAANRIVDMYAGADGGIAWDFNEAPYVLPDDTALNLTTTAGNSKVTVHYELH